MIPGFSLEGDMDSLLSLDKECHSENGLEFTESRFFLIADKSKSCKQRLFVSAAVSQQWAHQLVP